MRDQASPLAVARSEAVAATPLVLVAFADAYAAIEAAWSLLGAGFRVAALARSGAQPALRHVRGVRLFPVCAPEIDADRTVADVRAVIRALSPTIYLPLDDSAVWIGEQLGPDEIRVAGPVGDAARYALDKELQIEAAAEAGLLVPATEILSTLDEKQRTKFPLVVKPARALVSREGRLIRPKGEICADETEYLRAARQPSDGATLLQPLIRGTGEGLFGHATKDGVIGWSAHRRIRMVNPQGSASSACESRAVDPALLGPAERFLTTIGWRGLFMLEFLRDSDGRAWFMELNGRTWGSLALARRRGFEYPAWTVLSSLDASFKPRIPPNPPEIVCRNFGLELMHLAFVLRGPRSAALRDWPSPWSTIRELTHISRRDHLYNWKWSEPLVFAADTAQTVSFYLRRALAAAR